MLKFKRMQKTMRHSTLVICTCFFVCSSQSSSVRVFHFFFDFLSVGRGVVLVRSPGNQTIAAIERGFCSARVLRIVLVVHVG